MRSWGVHFIAYLPLWGQILLGVAAAAVAVGVWKARSLRWPDTALEEHPWSVAASAGAIFLIFASATALLGDGELWLNGLSAQIDQTGGTHAPLLLRVLGLIYGILHRAVNIEAQAFMRLVSVFSGIATVWAWLRLGKVTNVPARYVLLTGFAWGGIILFFGYIETYPPLVAVVSWMLVLMLTGLQADRRTDAIVALILAAVALALNLLAVVFLPAVLLFALQRFARVHWSARMVAWSSGGVLAAAGIVYLAFGWSRGTELLLPLLPPDRATTINPVGNGLLSVRHGLDLLNALILCAGPAAILAAVRNRELTADRRNLILAALLFPVAALVVHNAQLGGARDWDIAATCLTAVPVAGILAWAPTSGSSYAKSRNNKVLTGALGVWIALIIVPWLVVQHSESLSIRRFRDLLTMDPSVSASGWDYLMSYYLKRDDLPDWADCNREALKVSPNPRYHANLALYYVESKDWSAAELEAVEARRIIAEDSVITNWERWVTDPAAIRQRAAEYRKQHDFEAAEQADRIAAILQPPD